MPGTRSSTQPPPLDRLLQRHRLALFLDFDGTLVDIAPTPDAIRVAGHLAGGLAALAARLEGRLALVSGRSLDDLARHLGPLALACAGSHGIDRRLADGTPLGGEARAFPADLRARMADFASQQGLALEVKPHGAALHFRGRAELAGRAEVFASEMARTHGFRVKHGKSVVELVQPGADKGAAVRAFMDHRHFRGALPLFVGDDLTDEDGFAAVAALGGAGILVGERPGSLARWQLSTPAAVHRWLQIQEA